MNVSPPLVGAVPPSVRARGRSCEMRCLLSAGVRLAGYAFLDVNADGNRGRDHRADRDGNWVSIQATTASDGSYHFTGLIASDGAGYTIRELPAQDVLSGFGDGKDSLGSLGGVLSDDEFGAVILNVNANGTGYNFGELIL